MGKLGKKARKFAKKNLQSVHKRQRKMKSMFKRKSTRHRKDAVEDSHKLVKEQQKREISERIETDDNVSSNFVDDIPSEDDDNYLEDISDSDGFLSEDSECPYILEEENEDRDEDNAALMGENKKIQMEIAKQKTKLNSLLEKDPKFAKFLESQRADLEPSQMNEIYSDEEDGTDYPKGDKFSEHQHNKKTLTSYTIDVWCWLVMEQPNGPALSNLLNGFRTACQYGIGSEECPQRITNKEVFSKILTFVLGEADCIFRRLLGISDFCSQERILKLKNTPSWKTVEPLLKSYLRSCLFLLLNQVTDSQILDFALSRLKASIVFFSAFPSLIGRLVKISTHLWVTGEESLSFSAFLVIRGIASQLSSDCLDKCLSGTYKAFIAHCKFVQPTNLKHLEFLADSTVELFSLDIQESYQRALLAVQHLANILRQALKTKKKEELKKIYNWQYINCIKLWVKFISCNIKDHDLRPLSSLLIEVISGIAYLFPGPRYIPLRFKCVQMLNKLSSATGVFIPIASLLFDCLDYKRSNNADTRRSKPFDFASVLKVSKQLLKSRGFHEECIRCALDLLLTHFAQWSYHISFPEVATIPVILLKRFLDKTPFESLKRSVKRLIDQVEQNIEFIERKRDEVGFSPNDHDSVETFLQLEKSGSNASFTQYYASVLQKSWF